MQRTSLGPRDDNLIQASIGLRFNGRSGEARNSAADARIDNQEPRNRQASAHKSIHLTLFIASGLLSDSVSSRVSHAIGSN
jgi:hypothetical protein